MAFLDNSGDIILDAVLTDAGRKRLAEGNGSFRITKYSFGDDEIDYSNYNPNHASGSAYYDLEVLQTPVLEAFTNNTATMKSKLVTLTNNNLLYMPVIVLNTIDAANQPNNTIGSGSHVILADQTTVDTFTAESTGAGLTGYFINGINPGAAGTSRTIRCDQGLNTVEIPATYRIDAELWEHQYIVEMDNRFGTICTGLDPQITSTNAGINASFSFIDDDNVASYYLSTDAFVADTPVKPTVIQDPNTDFRNTAIAGPRGSHLVFRIRVSTNLRTSTYLFERLGSTFTYTLTKGSSAGTKKTFYYIDTIIRVTGATTGYKIDIPVRFIKQQ